MNSKKTFHKKGKTRLPLSLLLPLLFCCLSLTALGQQKAPSMRAGRYSSLPSGYTQVGTTQLYSKQYSDAIDMIGYYGGYYYSSTFSDYGYKLSVQVGKNSAVRVNCLDGTTNNGVTVQPSIEQQGEFARIVYTVTNANDEDVVISLGTHADVMIGNNDHAPISRRIDTFGQTYGLTMKDGNGAQLCVLFGSGLAGVSAVDDFWFGYYSLNRSESAMVGNYSSGSNYMQENGSYDSGMGWCWKNRTIPAGSTVVFSYLMGVGDVNLEPNSTFEVTPEDPEGWNDLSRPHRLTVNGTYESPAGIDGIIEYAVEDRDDWNAFTDTLSSGEEFVSSLLAMFDPTRPVHVIRFRTVDAVGNTTLLQSIEYIDVSFHSVTGIQDMTFTGDSIYQPNLACDLEEGQYTYIYRNNVNAGVASVNLEGVFPYTIGRRTYTFTIHPQLLVGGIDLSESSFVYNGQPFNPEWQFTNADYASLVLGQDYTVSWTNNTLPGTGTLTITGVHNYTGTLTVNFFIDKAQLVDELFNVTLPEQDITYDGQAHGASVTTANGVGTATIYYLKEGESVPTTTMPTEPGDYTIYLEIAEGSLYYGRARYQIGSFSIYQISDEEWAIIQAFQEQYAQTGWSQPWDLSQGIKSVATLPGLTVEEGHVTAINLKEQGLEGGFPTMLLSLDELRTLDLSYNNLSGDAASDMAQYAAAEGITATGLQNLYINNNEFTGNVGQMAALFGNLTHLNVSANHFDKVYPMVNPGVNLNLSEQLLEVDADITPGIESLITSIPTICLYDHAAQTFLTSLSAQLTDQAQSPVWNMDLSFNNGAFNMYTSSPYRGLNGQILDGYTWLNSSWYNEQLLKVKFTFAPGDANINGPVDITDLQAMVNYIFGEYNRPFNFTAANLNNDNTVNVQDVVGEVGLLLSMDLTMDAPGPGRAPSIEAAAPQASLYWMDGVLYLDTSVPVAALDIVNDVNGDIKWNVSGMGMVAKTTRTAQGEHTVIYSLGDAVIPPGVTAIATTTVNRADVVAAKLSDTQADLVSVTLNDGLTHLTDVLTDGNVQCQLDGNSLIINSGNTLDDVNIGIYTIDGKMIANKHLSHLDSGKTRIGMSDVAHSNGYLIIVVRNGRQVIATQKLTQNR